ncbi:hypothetical protein BT96DRAFT_990727 [Gymnopus androsaceus JB14]|uniref:Uncharacterized protein n=1 Tax=Gymnopus androsaceus JB14 TaxID=1447944 RepID=A0A6A4I113_9AGAR|nr:hypothetical protein BT96DRAFT_990727 [Gymnopus androsaceus JB14]
MPSPGFSSVGMQLLSSLTQFIGITILTHCISRRLAGERLSSFSDLVNIPWPRLCLIFVLLDSWLFVFSSGILIFGVGLELNAAVCSVAVDICIAFYATSKILVYFYLIERVHIVWAPVEGRSRLRSPVDVICFITVSLYAVVIALLIAGRISFLRSGDDSCVIGLKAMASIPLLAYDLYINVFLTSMFLWPILRNGHPNQKVKRVARRALVASLIGLTTSSINIGVLYGLHGELGWVCLASCGVDVTLNSYALFWATGLKSRRRNRALSTVNEGLVSRELNMFASKQSMPTFVSPNPNSNVQLPPAARPSGRHGIHFHLPHFPHMPHLPHFPHVPHLNHNPFARHRPHVPHPFATPVFVPGFPQSEVTISANPELAEKAPSVNVFRSLADLFRDEPDSKNGSKDNLQVTVTTQLVVEHEDVGDYGLNTIHETV